MMSLKGFASERSCRGTWVCMDHSIVVGVLTALRS